MYLRTACTSGSSRNVRIAAASRLVRLKGSGCCQQKVIMLRQLQRRMLTVCPPPYEKPTAYAAKEPLRLAGGSHPARARCNSSIARFAAAVRFSHPCGQPSTTAKILPFESDIGYSALTRGGARNQSSAAHVQKVDTHANLSNSSSS